MSTYYRRPGWFTRNAMNRLVAALTSAGFSLRGAAVLTVAGRRSGQPRSTPVNVLALDGNRYLVAPRGETEWARNLRAAGEAQLRVGRRIESVRARELGEEDKVPVLRAYLAQWRIETGVFFDGVSSEASVEDFRRIAPRHPVFLIETAG